MVVPTLLTAPMSHVIGKEKYDCTSWRLDQIFSQDVIVVVNVVIVVVVVDNVDVVVVELEL